MGKRWHRAATLGRSRTGFEGQDKRHADYAGLNDAAACGVMIDLRCFFGRVGLMRLRHFTAAGAFLYFLSHCRFLPSLFEPSVAVHHPKATCDAQLSQT